MPWDRPSGGQEAGAQTPGLPQDCVPNRLSDDGGLGAVMGAASAIAPAHLESIFSAQRGGSGSKNVWPSSSPNVAAVPWGQEIGRHFAPSSKS